MKINDIFVSKGAIWARLARQFAALGAQNVQKTAFLAKTGLTLRA